MAARAKKKTRARAAKRPKAKAKKTSRVGPSARGQGPRAPRRKGQPSKPHPGRRIGPPSGKGTKKRKRANWSKARAPGKGDIDRKDYERSAIFKRRQAAAKTGQKARAEGLKVQLEKRWTRLKELKALGRGDLARRGFKKFSEVRDAIGRISRSLQKQIMVRVNRDVGGARGAWRDYGKGGQKR